VNEGQQGIRMTDSQTTAAIADRISRIENSVSRGAPLWSEDIERQSIPDRMDYYKTPGLSVALINGGMLEWARGYGVLENGKSTQVTANTIFQVCSISKHVAMVGTLSLAQAGLIDLDEDINRYLASWKLPANGAWQPRVTVRQLLGHTAGLTSNWYRGFRQGERIPTLLQVLEGQPPANTPPVRSVLIPGSQFRYSGSHYSVLQQLLVDVTNTLFPQLMRELVFEPLNMTNSSYDQAYPDARPDSTAVGHYIGGEPVHGKWRILPEMAAAGLWTTATDLALLAIEIQRAHAGESSRVLRKETVDQALTSQVAESFGLGMELGGPAEGRHFGHGGDNIGYKCLTTAYIEGGMGAVMLTNGDDGFGVMLDLLRAIAEEYRWPDETPKRTAISLSPQIYDGYVGAYELRPAFTCLVSKQGDRLFLHVTNQAPFELQPLSEATFFAQVLNSQISFTKSDTGEVTGLNLEQEQQNMQAKKVR
jgi:CubicO group peptidase (beta-lactamase class C family)